MKQNAREVDKLVEEYLKIFPYISKEKVGDLTKNQKIAICISDLLSIMPEKEVTFINFRYIKGWTIVKIAQEMNYSQQMIYVVRKKALKKIYHGIYHLLKEKSWLLNPLLEDTMLVIEFEKNKLPIWLFFYCYIKNVRSKNTERVYTKRRL